MDPMTVFAVGSGLASLLGGLFGRKSSKKSMAGADLRSLMPQLQALLKLQQRDIMRTNPGAADLFGMQAPPGAVPLQDAIAQLAFSLLPRSAQAGAQSELRTGPREQTVFPGRQGGQRLF